MMFVVVLIVCLALLRLELTEGLSSSATSKKGTAIVAGATGYIGKSVVRESVRQGYRTIALVRDKSRVESAAEQYGSFFEGAEVVECDVSDPNQLLEQMETIKETCSEGRIDAVISCLASRSGIKREAFAIDYQATLNCLEAGTACGAEHFVLLSAICVRKPKLQFQRAKLKFEAALLAQDAMTYSIVRPTAFFKSVSGQLDRLQDGKSFLMFQDSTRCNPIAEADLATYLVDCVKMPTRRNQIIDLGGPDKAMSKIEQGEMIFDAIGKDPTYSRLPVSIFDVSINLLQWLADIFRSEQLENAAELGRIGKYYAVEDMVENDNRYGTITLQEYFNQIAAEGQEFDPYTTMTGKNTKSRPPSLPPRKSRLTCTRPSPTQVSLVSSVPMRKHRRWPYPRTRQCQQKGCSSLMVRLVH
ncbi:MAG: hypothetical protein SGILL_003244 [Bacillariaceae sp.]